jgi:hypothetical protein
MKFKNSDVRQNMIMTGDRFRIVKYDQPYSQKSHSSRYDSGRKPSKPSQQAQKDKNRAYSVRKAYAQIRDLIYANYGYHNELAKFFTLTFKGDAGLPEANKKFHLFIKRVNFYLKTINGRKLQYIAVPEFQNRGATHYHVIVFNFPFIDGRDIFHKTINKFWPYGFVEATKIRVSNGLEPVVLYMTKYIRTQKLDPRFDNKKRFFHSEGLFQPQIIKNSSPENEVLIHMVKNSLARFCKGTKIADNKFLGKIETAEYIMDEDAHNHISKELLDAMPDELISELPPNSPFVVAMRNHFTKIDNEKTLDSLFLNS